jgi:hypothetical protein
MAPVACGEMAEEVLEARAVEEELTSDHAGDETGEVRPLPATKRAGDLAVRGEVTTAALAAAGGVVAGAATVAVVKAIGAVSRHNRGRIVRGRKPAKVVASRSFLVDIHVLGDR